MIRKLLRFLLRPLLRFVLRFLPVDDPWERLTYAAPLHAFGEGARLDFTLYLQGESMVPVKSLDDVLSWLAECEYVRDPDLFHEGDFWQHPRTFEHLRKGDCEDYALWAWRKLIELGYDSEFIVGRCPPPPVPDRGHARVIFRRDGEEFLLEPVERDPNKAVQPLSAVRARYIPEFGVTRDGKRFTFTGYIYFLQKRLRERKESARSSGRTA